jgi:signal transduction histidine kinase
VTTFTDAHRYADLKAQLAIPHNPFAVVASPVAWRSVWYCATSVVLGWITLTAGVFGFLFFPWVSDMTTQIERRRVNLLGLPALVASAPTQRGWRETFSGESSGTFGVWAVTAVFAVVDTLPGALLGMAIFAGLAGVESSFRYHSVGLQTLLSIGWFYLWLTISLYVAWALAAAQAYAVHSVLLPFSALNERVAELTSSRSELVDLFEAERRRIERDLHDGAQQHLVVSTMHLGEAVYWLDQANQANARGAVLAAQTSIEDALAALRNTIHGIHPQVLTDRGLVAAVRELTARQPLRSGFTVTGTPVQLDQHVESAAYYVTSEALTNVARHARATQAQVQLNFDDRRLLLQVWDDGHGGARNVPGHGVSGLAERTRTAGGTFELTSPPGGPTLVSATFPYHRKP